MTVCKRVTYSGTVQGVGFRYTTRNLAEGFAVAGYVRNLPEGTVELLAQGEAAEVQRFLDAVARRMAGYIEGHTILEETPGERVGFTIRR
ncbi:MAG: acylphosphatase [Gemmataceae bacterium]|nr:acylphosphatase [Gemmataceae bacterium]